MYHPVIPAHRVFQWRRLQCLVVPQERYGERSEPALKRKRLSQPRKESQPLGASTRRSPSPVSRSGSDSFFSFAVRDTFSYAEAHFHSPTLSSALSNTETIVSTSQETRRKLDEDAAIIQTLTKHGSERSSTRTVHGKRHA